MVFMVDRLGHRCVPGEIGDGLDGYAVVAHDRYEGMPQLARRPIGAEPGSPGDRPERPADVRVVQRLAGLAGEYQAMIVPERACGQPFLELVRPVLLEVGS